MEVLPECAHLEHVRLVLFDAATSQAYVDAAEKISRESKTGSIIFTTLTSAKVIT
jgi:hypothetical protein